MCRSIIIFFDTLVKRSKYSLGKITAYFLTSLFSVCKFFSLGNFNSLCQNFSSWYFRDTHWGTWNSCVSRNMNSTERVSNSLLPLSSKYIYVESEIQTAVQVSDFCLLKFCTLHGKLGLST